MWVGRRKVKSKTLDTLDNREFLCLPLDQIRVNVTPKVCSSMLALFWATLFSGRSVMGTESNFGSSVSRRSFLKGSAVLVGASALSFESFLAACSTGSTSSVATATVNSMPPSSNPGALYVFKQLVKQFDSTHANSKIEANNNPYDPTPSFPPRP